MARGDIGPPTITVELLGLREMRGRFDRVIGEGIFGVQRTQIGALAEGARDRFKEDAPKGKGPLVGRPERFYESIREDVNVLPGEFTVAIRTSQGLLRTYIKKGTRRHIIRAKGRANGGADALFWPGAAHPVRSVNHPGTKANPWEDKAVATIHAETMTLFGRRLTESTARRLRTGSI